MHFPDPHEDSSNRWVPMVCGLLLGLLILSIFLETQKPKIEEEPPLPPRIALDVFEDGITSHEATDLLIEAVVQIESQGNPDQVGSVGERGLMQIRESTWNEVTARHFEEPVPFDQAFDPEWNRKIGRLYLGDLQVFLYRHREDWKSDLRSLLLASYNAGPERVREAGFNLRRLPKVVQSYAQRGSALHDWYLGDHSEEMRVRLMEAGE